MARASANGHPTREPVANSNVANSVLCVFFKLDGSNANAYANVVVYIANEDGSKAKEWLEIWFEKASLKFYQ